MTRPTLLRRLDPGASLRRLDLAAPARPIPSEMERGNAERAKLYQSPRWRRERRAFLRVHPICATPGCRRPATVADHRDGHQRPDWRERFWDQTTWQPLCAICHASKSRGELTAWRGGGEGYSVEPGRVSTAVVLRSTRAKPAGFFR